MARWTALVCIGACSKTCGNFAKGVVAHSKMITAQAEGRSGPAGQPRSSALCRPSGSTKTFSSFSGKLDRAHCNDSPASDRKYVAKDSKSSTLYETAPQYPGERATTRNLHQLYD